MKIGVTGCAGRMGKMLMSRVLTHNGCELAGGSERRESGFIGRDLGEVLGGRALGITVTAYPFELFDAVDAVLDFTAPAASVEHAKIAAETGKILIVGTTGLTAEQTDVLKKCAEKTVIVAAPNMSVGVNLLFALVKRAAAVLDPSYDVEIVEMHHRNKADAPSGTALGLGRAAAEGRQVALDDVARYERHGIIGARPAGEIGFAALRGGDVVGDHTVIFAGAGERVELTHKAASREIFADGAIKAALWAQGKPAGLYTMQDVLGL
ncbi:MAG TPA: 4-hydroxy-tetrahydrodipicolinate reductase [Alphaproteobacteria bacterium]|nr:4-hydroxy-tetrahydrodipicolinate reductase [Alphaproteobacteria bacterium]